MLNIKSFQTSVDCKSNPNGYSVMRRKAFDFEASETDWGKFLEIIEFSFFFLSEDTEVIE